MSISIDRFELMRDSSNKVKKGWRIERFISLGVAIIQHLRSGESKTGVIDDFGNIIDCHHYLVTDYAYNNEEIVPFYI